MAGEVSSDDFSSAVVADEDDLKFKHRRSRTLRFDSDDEDDYTETVKESNTLDEDGPTVDLNNDEGDKENTEFESTQSIGRSKKRHKIKVFSESESDNDAEIVKESNTLDEDGPTVDVNNDEGNKENTEFESTQSTVRSKKRHKIKVFSESESDNDADQTTTINSTPNKFAVLKEKKTDLVESVKPTDSSISKTLQLNSELYDAENSSSNEGEKYDNDEEIGLDEIKKNARDSVVKKNRKNRSDSKRKLKKSERDQLHRDSQRLLREGRVNLPYHIPPKRTLQEFRNRKKCLQNSVRATDIKLKNEENLGVQSNEMQNELEKVTNLENQMNDCNEIEFECRNVLEKLCEKVCEFESVVEEVDEDAALPPSEDNFEECLKALPISKRILLRERLVNATPKLNGQSHSVICFDDENEEEVSSNKVQQFINRFAEHKAAISKINSLPREVELNILKQENDSTGEIVFNSEKLVVTLKEKNVDQIVDSSKPGCFRMLFKKSLEEKMAKRRAQIHIEQKQSSHRTDSSNDDYDDELSEDDEAKTQFDAKSLVEDSESDENNESDKENDIVEGFTKKTQGVENKFVDDEAEEEDNTDDDDDDDCEDNYKEDKPQKVQNKFVDDEAECTEGDCTEDDDCEDDQFDNKQNYIDEIFPEIHNETEDNELNKQEFDMHNDSTFTDTQKILSSQFVLNNRNLYTCSNATYQNEIDDKLPSTQENLDELAGLCSGKWTTQATNTEAKPLKFMCGTPVKSYENLTELADLCSGKFPEDTVHNCTQQQLSGINELPRSNYPSDDELSVCSLTSENLRQRRFKRIVSDSDNESNGSESSKDDKTEVKDRKPLKNNVKDFMDDEAELSGSDIPSDEDYDVAEEDDVMLEEMGDLDQFSEEDLKDQVEKVHMKLMMDDDQRELRHFKELYLEDGEFHLDGVQRQRKFRWSNVSDALENDENKDSDSDVSEKEDEEDQEIRKRRFDRELWLTKENKTLERDFAEKDNDDSIFAKFQHKIKLYNHSVCQKVETPVRECPRTNAQPRMESVMIRGSFLSKKDEYLSKIAKLTKTTSDGPSGPNNSRNFVFATMSPPNERKSGMKRRSNSSNPTNKIMPKRICPERVSSTTGSQNGLFNLL